MPRPENYVSRSALGWGPSPAGRADPKSGLVIHYDSTDQRLADKPHAECLAYWRRVREFHTGPARGWADIGYCVDESTEILTEDGWKTFRQVNESDIVLTLHHETGMSQWQPVLAVNIFPKASRELVLMEGRDHSSLTTPAHRWPVERFHRRTGTEGKKDGSGKWAATGRAERAPQGRERVWATTESLTYRDRVPLSAPCGGLPTEPKWSDALVELVAWFWAEGHDKPQSRSRSPGTGVAIRQSEQKNPGNAARIRAALHALFGPACDGFPPPGPVPDGVPRWGEARNRNVAEFRLSAGAERVLADQAPDRVPRHEFLRTLTRAQLDLFLQVSLLADGHGNRTVDAQALSQKSRAAAEAFQFAATLAGHATSLRRRPPTKNTKYDMWKVELRRKTHFSPKAAAARESTFSITREPYEGHIWCPTTPNGTWLARRKGTVYFTGNSFMACPHAYVIEGRGLFRTQAAQPGGNTTHYSVTLATGPTDEITPGQVNAVRQLREWLMEPRSSIAGTVKGHRDFVPTSCPGDEAYALVRNGTFAEPATWGSIPSSEDDMPHYLNMAHTKRVEIPPSRYVALRWDTVWTDTAGTAHKDGLAVMTRPGDVNGALWLDLEGLETGREVQIRMVDYIRATKEYQLHPPAEGLGTGGREFPVIPVVNRIADGRTMDLRLHNVGRHPIHLNRATFKGHVWPR
ncbi:Hint domain-containing protein [Actinorugispora endophytica]|uniref:Hint domain-containing protein n=1 Tax=Actinorugispora endophytica TaxID=1605990 RepID=A0A4R6V4I4_9ACTN|nr:Hint domain-containing protein [Actinorugispora endophytica]TDQ55184.1 hypothetical protein EV190_101509 [Actinorugispora endophytica]